MYGIHWNYIHIYTHTTHIQYINGKRLEKHFYQKSQDISNWAHKSYTPYKSHYARQKYIIFYVAHDNPKCVGFIKLRNLKVRYVCGLAVFIFSYIFFVWKIENYYLRIMCYIIRFIGVYTYIYAYIYQSYIMYVCSGWHRLK